MFSIVKRFNRQITTVKKFRPPVDIKKHEYDIENESWTDPKKQKTVYVYKLVEVKRNVNDKIQETNYKKK